MKSTRPSLTEKETRVLQFIEQSILKEGIAPSYQEICDGLGFSSFNSVQNYLKQLTKKGYIAISPHQKRSIQILASTNQFKQQHLGAELGSVPLLGRVAAGQPIEALIEAESLNVPANFLNSRDRFFALQVQGRSMIDEGILDGDFIVVRSTHSIENGSLAVATVNEEATVKRIYRGTAKKVGYIELRPSNQEMSSLWYPAELVQVRGVVTGLVRRYLE